MNILLSVGLFVFGLIVMIYSAEKLVKGIVGTSLKLGISAFVIATVFVGFDPENLATGASGAFEGIHGIAMGSILGAIMIPIGLAFGVTALATKMRFKKISKPVVFAPVAIVSLLYALSIDGLVSRIDGIILILAFCVTAAYLFRGAGKIVDMKPRGELKESLEEAKELSKWKAISILVLALVGIIAGSLMVVEGARPIIDILGISDTVFGMTIIAFLISIEELAKQLPAALKGRFDISYGNMFGSVIHFLLLNAGLIALVNPIKLDPIVLLFYFPVVLATTIFISLIMLKKDIPRWAGAVLVLVYMLFVIRGYAP